MLNGIRVDFCFEFGTRAVNMRVPFNVSFSRLKELIAQGFINEGILLPSRWFLEPKFKKFNLDVLDRVSDFPFGNGDVFMIVAGGEIGCIV